MEELAKAGRDPRKSFEQFQFDDSVHSMDDLYEGMMLPAIITNITKFIINITIMIIKIIILEHI